jgi:hypothetical protein
MTDYQRALPPGNPQAIPAALGRPKEVTALEYGRCALRTFAFNSDYMNFGSVSAFGNFWADGTCTAECLAVPKGGMGAIALGRAFPSPDYDGTKDHEAPNEDCSCGIYGTLTLEHLISQYPLECRSIVAVFAAQGQTIIGDLGLQTQYARVIAYWLKEAQPSYDPFEYTTMMYGSRPNFDPLRLAATAAVQFKGATYFQHIDQMLRAYGFPSVDPMVLERHGFTKHHRYVRETAFFDALDGGPVWQESGSSQGVIQGLFQQQQKQSWWSKLIGY